MVKIQNLKASKTQVDRAGEALRLDMTNEEARQNAREFRSCHNYPLNKIAQLVTRRLRSLRIQRTTVAQRLKRLPTIIDKLNRLTLDGRTSNKVRLSQMDDIGGCRVIVNSISDVFKLTKSLEGDSASHSLRVKEYIEAPKESGYRSVHLLFKSFAHQENHASKGLRIELQIRTRIQHAWATAVEIVDIFESLDLKTNANTTNKMWSDLFKYSSRMLAISEMGEDISSEDYVTLKNKLVNLNTQLKAWNKISDFKELINITTKPDNLKKYTVYILTKSKESLQGKYYTSNDFTDAEKFYQESEDNVDIMYTALVSTKNFEAFHKAYPNFLADARYFLTLLSLLLESDKIIDIEPVT